MAIKLNITEPENQEINIIDPALFKVGYLATQKKWYEVYKKLLAVAQNEMLFQWALEI